MKSFVQSLRGGVVLFSVALGLAGCGRAQRGPADITWADLLGRLTNTMLMAQLDAPDTGILTSYDPAGSNDDYNHFPAKGPEGWVILADLKGPGCLDRFWFTGAESGAHRLRFFFDGEREPRLDTTLAEFCGGREPFRPPLAAAENFCWYNWIPLPFQKRLVVMTQAGGYKPGGFPRLFFQIHYTRFVPEKRVESFTGQLTAADQARLAAVRAAWDREAVAPAPAGCAAAAATLDLAPGAAGALEPLNGPAVIRRLSITPDFAALKRAADRERLLRDTVLTITWDGAEAPSVAVPLGDFFGSTWRRLRYQSLFFGMTGDTFLAAFPMPFAKSAAIRIENQGPLPIRLDVAAEYAPVDAWDPGWGYFHAAWSRSGPEDVGRPHPILQATGRGKYAGCVLDVVSLDPSWWILEGDELMYADGQAQPVWHGTGLEDYFNGGWYYQNVLTRPLHGMFFKAFFRIGQYRLHLVDPVGFRTAFNMVFERGPNHASRGWMESVAYYYIEKPTAAAPLPPATGRAPPNDPVAEATIMTELGNYERFGDYRGAREYIDCFLETRTNFPRAEMLRLRQAAYTERIDGLAAARPLYEQFAASANTDVAEQARLLLWFHESPSNALASLYSAANARLYVNGKDTVAAAKPDRVFVAGVQLGGERLTMAVNTRWQSYPVWVQAGLRTHAGVVGTGPDWKYAFRPQGSWSAADYDDRGWAGMASAGRKGPPEEPYVWLEPNAFIDLHSQPMAVFIGDELWPDKQGTMVYRKVFDFPLTFDAAGAR